MQGSRHLRRALLLCYAQGPARTDSSTPKKARDLPVGCKAYEANLNATTSARSASLIIRQEDPAQPDVVELLSHGEAFSASLYPPESNHHLPLDALRRPEVRFFVARDAEGKTLATGAVVLHDDWAEVKRMWVEDAARRQGTSRAKILDVLVAEAVAAGIEKLRLETGIANHAALAPVREGGLPTSRAVCRLSPRSA